MIEKGRRECPQLVCVRPHTSAYVSIRQHTSTYAGPKAREVCPRTPGSIVSKQHTQTAAYTDIVSVALRPNEQDLERLEIATSQILCRPH
jgi:hypothetical protein